MRKWRFPCPFGAIFILRYVILTFMKRWQKILIGVVIAAVVIAVVVWRRSSNSDATVQTESVQKRTVVQEVTFTGRLRAKRRASLAFESTGTLREVAVELGDRVTAGQTLAKLDTRASSLEAAKARADQRAAQHQTLSAWESASLAAQHIETENKKSLETKRQIVRDAKVEMDQAKEVWQQTVRESGDEGSVGKVKYAAFLSAQTAYRNAQQSLTQVEATVTKTNTAARQAASESLSAYYATQQASLVDTGLSSSQALEALANLRVAKAVAVAPFDGVITAKNLNAGELASAGQVVVTVESADEMEVVADVPESDITKLAQDMEAVFSLDAFTDGRQVNARIVSVAPAAKVLEGVPTYEVVLAFQGAETLRPGMTANVTVKTAHKEGVLAIPRRAVFRTGGAYKVNIVGQDAMQAEREVSLGVLGTDGYIEITKGLSEGETVVVSQTQAN